MASHENHAKNYADVIDEFVDVQVDPFITAVFEKISLYNELLAEQYVSGEQINEIMNELDDCWRNLMHKEAIITGAVSYAHEDSLGQEGLVSREFYEEHPMMFGGVLPVQVDTLLGSGNYANDELKKYKLELRLTREGITSEGGFVEMHGSADITEIASIEFPNTMSVERARKWLEFYMPDILEDIDVAILKPSIEECEMVMRLSDFEVDLRLPHDETDEHTLKTMQALNIYTNSLFNFDEDAPYQLTVDGDAWQCDLGDLLSPAVIQGSTMIAVDRMVWLNRDNGPQNIFRPHIAARFLGTTKDDEDTKMHVPVASIKDFRSYRYGYFVGYSDGK